MSADVAENPLVPKLVLELDDDNGLTDREEFLAFEAPNQWAIMQNAQARKGSRSDQAAALFELARTSVKEDVINPVTGMTERERFLAWMMLHGRDELIYDKVWDALNALWAGESRLPLERISSDSGESTGEIEPDTTDSSSGPVSEPNGAATGWPVQPPIQARPSWAYPAQGNLEESGSSSPDLISTP